MKSLNEPCYIETHFSVNGGHPQDFLKMYDCWIIITNDGLSVYPLKQVDEKEGAFWGEAIGSIEFNQPHAQSVDSKLNLSYVDDIYTVHTGGGCMVDVVNLPDKSYFGVTDECIGHYPPDKNRSDFLQDCLDDGKLIWLV